MRQVGFVVLAHNNVFRLRQILQFLLDQGAAISLHIDAKMPDHQKEALAYFLKNRQRLHIVPSIECSWGEWSIVEAQIAATKLLMEKQPELRYIYHISGSCLPLRSVRELEVFLGETKEAYDYIESVPIGDETWVVDGLENERVEFYHPFNWQKQRRLFDWNVKIQRALKVKRKMPEDLTISFGSQWWCLTTSTLQKIFNDPRFDEYVEFFKKSWIPDESFMQSLARKHSPRIETRSLTYATFDSDGKPFLIYDDHLPILKRLDSFFIRKIWRGADELYRHFLSEDREVLGRDVYAKLEIEALLTYAKDTRSKGRIGLISQFSLPFKGKITHTRAPYYVYVGFHSVRQQFYDYFQSSSTKQQMGYLFHPSRTEFDISKHGTPKNMNDLYKLRDYDKFQFLLQRIWYAFPRNIAFMAKPHHLSKLEIHLAADKHANLLVINGAWLIELFHRNIENIERLRTICRVEMRRETAFWTRLNKANEANIQTFDLSTFLNEPSKISPHLPDQMELAAPNFDREGFAKFVTHLVNNGIPLQDYHPDQLVESLRNPILVEDEKVVSLVDYARAKNE